MDSAVQTYHVLSCIGKSPYEIGKDAVRVGGENTDSLVTGVGMGVIGLGALAAIGSGTASLVLTTSTVVDIACTFLFIVTSVVVVQKVKLRKLGTFRAEHNELRQEINTFTAENERLKEARIRLDNEVTKLKEVEEEYEQLRKKIGKNVDRLAAIVKENGEIQSKLRKNLESKVVQQALDTILQADTDEDFSISQKEIPQLKLRLRNISGVIFDEENFNKLYNDLEDELHVKDIMRLFLNLKDPNVPEKENIFHFETKDLAPKSRNILGF